MSASDALSDAQFGNVINLAAERQRRRPDPYADASIALVTHLRDHHDLSPRVFDNGGTYDDAVRVHDDMHDHGDYGHRHV